MLTAFLLGGWAATAVTAYILSRRARRYRSRLHAADKQLNHLEDVIENLKSNSDKLSDPDERARLLAKISTQPR